MELKLENVYVKGGDELAKYIINYQKLHNKIINVYGDSYSDYYGVFNEEKNPLQWKVFSYPYKNKVLVSFEKFVELFEKEFLSSKKYELWI